MASITTTSNRTPLRWRVQWRGITLHERNHQPPQNLISRTNGRPLCSEPPGRTRMQNPTKLPPLADRAGGCGLGCSSQTGDIVTRGLSVIRTQEAITQSNGMTRAGMGSAGSLAHDISSYLSAASPPSSPGHGLLSPRSPGSPSLVSV